MMMFLSGLAWATVAALLVALLLGLYYYRTHTLLIIGSLSAAALAAEGLLQVAYPPSWHPLTKIFSRNNHHVDRPNARSYQGRADGKFIVVRTNNDGFRSEHQREEFGGYPSRIAVLGDSFTFGMVVRQEAAFPQVMERLLRQEFGSTAVAVLNAGTISYSPLLGLRIFDGIVTYYHPTLVMYMLDATDIGDDYKYESELVGDAGDRHFDWTDTAVTPYYGALGRLLNLEKVLNIATSPMPSLRPVVGLNPPSAKQYSWSDFRVQLGASVETNRFFIYRHPLSETRHYFDRTYGYVEALAASVRRSGGEFVLVVTPRFHHWNPKECPGNWESFRYARNEPYQYEYFRFFEERRATAPFQIINLLPAFQATREFPLVLDDDPHWNEAGNAFVARELADRVSDRLRHDGAGHLFQAHGSITSDVPNR